MKVVLQRLKTLRTHDERARELLPPAPLQVFHCILVRFLQYLGILVRSQYHGVRVM